MTTSPQLDYDLFWKALKQACGKDPNDTSVEALAYLRKKDYDNARKIYAEEHRKLLQKEQVQVGSGTEGRGSSRKTPVLESDPPVQSRGRSGCEVG